MGAQQWHLKQLGQEFCFIFISQQTETGSCCCKIYKEKIRRKCKVFHGVFLSYQTIFSLASYFHGKLTWIWATVEVAGRTTRAHYESVGFIKNIASLAQHFNVTKSRQNNVCFPLLPLLCLGYSFRIFFSSSRVSFAANCQRKFLGGSHKKSRVYLPSMYTACPAQVLCINFKFTFMSCRAEYEIEYRLSYMSLWHESSLELIATSHRHRHPDTQFQCPKSKEIRKKIAYKTSDKKGKTCRIIAKCFSLSVPPSPFCLLHFTAIRVGHTFGSFSCPAVPGGILPFYVYVAEAKNRLWSVPHSSRPPPYLVAPLARLTVP